MFKEQSSNNNNVNKPVKRAFNDNKKPKNLKSNKNVAAEDGDFAFKKKARYPKYNNRSRGRKLPADAALSAENRVEDNKFLEKKQDGDNRSPFNTNKERGARNFRKQRFNNEKKLHETIEDIKQDIARIEKEIKLALAELKSTDMSL